MSSVASSTLPCSRAEMTPMSVFEASSMVWVFLRASTATSSSSSSSSSGAVLGGIGLLLCHLHLLRSLLHLHLLLGHLHLVLIALLLHLLCLLLLGHARSLSGGRVHLAGGHLGLHGDRLGELRLSSEQAGLGLGEAGSLVEPGLAALLLHLVLAELRQTGG